jgi:hypothetical protein
MKNPWEKGLVKQGYLYVRELDPNNTDQAWAIQRYGFFSEGMGDMIYATLRKILEDEDDSDWAMEAFLYCVELLQEKKRWPDYMQFTYKEFIARNSIEEVYYKLKYHDEHRLHGLYGIPPEHPIKYRPQRQMTRDPYILLYACAIFLENSPNVIKDIDRLDLATLFHVPMPLRNYNMKVWEWTKKLQGRPNCYDFLNRFTAKDQPEFVEQLQRFMDWSIDNIKPV